MSKPVNEIVLHPYNPNWKICYASEIELLRAQLDSEQKSIIHIGSTSIEGMVAKPIIDISVAVYELKDSAFYLELLSGIGYVYGNGSKFEEWILLSKTYCGQQYHLHLMSYNSARHGNNGICSICHAFYCNACVDT